MRAIITVTAYPSMPSRYTVKSDAAKDRRGYSHPVDAQGAEAAAAAAMEYAQRCGSTGYVIFAPREALNLIPDDMRSRP